MINPYYEKVYLKFNKFILDDKHSIVSFVLLCNFG